MTNNYIKITNEKGEHPLYSGIYMKIMLSNISIEECNIMKPQEEVRIIIPDLFKSYDMKNFEFKQIEVQYRGFFGISNSVVFDKFF